MSVVTPRSSCPQCEATISWYDNIPVLSFLLLRGRCRRCQTRIPLRYPFVEAVTAILLGGVVARFGLTLAAAKWSIFESLMLILFCTDLELQILPDEFTLGGAVVGCAFAWLVTVPSMALSVFADSWPATIRSVTSAITGGLCLPILLWGFASLYRRVRRLVADPLGLGDVKLMALIGLFFGLEKSIPVFVFATICGALVGGTLLILRGNAAWKYEIPFGSFLCAAAGLAVFTSAAPA